MQLKAISVRVWGLPPQKEIPLYVTFGEGNL